MNSVIDYLKKMVVGGFLLIAIVTLLVLAVVLTGLTGFAIAAIQFLVKFFILFCILQTAYVLGHYVLLDRKAQVRNEVEEG